jgi:glutathione synthase/RimK-type ligase-like ATP-grasp enzyme
MSTVLLATFAILPDGEEGGHRLVEAFGDLGVEARWVAWDDPDVDWAAADLVAVRSTWDYHRRLTDFLAWARATEQVTTVLNGAEVFAWNADKAYLLELAEHVPTVPTRLLEDRGLVPTLRAALDELGTVLVKPRTGAGGTGVVLADSTSDPRLEGLTAGPWVVQPVVESVRTEGETSVFVLEGQPVSRVDKVPAGGEVRVHEHFGGSSREGVLDEETSAVATAAVAAASRLRGADLAYARVDLMRLAGGTLAVSELELIEPGLYLDVVPGNAARFARAVAARL